MADKKIERLNDEIVIDGKDVERAQRLAEKRHGDEGLTEDTIRINSDETLTIAPKR